MKRLTCLILSFALILSSCAAPSSSVVDVVQNDSSQVDTEPETENTDMHQEEALCTNQSIATPENSLCEISGISGLDDPSLLNYMKSNVYTNLVEQLHSDEYYVEGVEAVYYPKEYIDALSSNTKENIYFGYTSSELNEVFQGRKYIFTLDNNGQTVAKPMDVLTDDTCSKMMTDAIVGTGVILVCVTISIVSAPVAPAVSIIFACSAATGAEVAVNAGQLSFLSAAIVTGYQTEDFQQAIKAGACSAAESYKWGAIIGSSLGGVSETAALVTATKNGLSMNQAALLQMETQWPVEAISAIHSPEEAQIYIKSGLFPQQLPNGEWAFLQKVNWQLIDSYGRSNVNRVLTGLAPIDETGMPYELHHIGMRADSPLAILTNAQHHSKDNFDILHYKDEGKNVADNVWQKQKQAFWESVLEIAKEQGLA